MSGDLTGLCLYISLKLLCAFLHLPYKPPGQPIEQLGSKLTTDRQTHSLTPYTGVCRFFLSLNLLPPLLASLAGGSTEAS